MSHLRCLYQRRRWHPLQCSRLESPMDGGAWGAAVQGVAKSRTRLSDFSFAFHFSALEKAMAPTPVFLPGESQGQGSRWTQSRTRLKRLNKSNRWSLLYQYHFLYFICVQSSLTKTKKIQNNEWMCNSFSQPLKELLSGRRRVYVLRAGF